MPKKTTTQRASKSRRHKRPQARWTKHWLTRIIAALITAAAVYYYWPQLRSLTDVSKHQLSARAINDTAELQIALAREGFSPGSIDGASGSQTRAALLAYQTSHGLPRSGAFDADTAQFLQIQEPVFITRRLGTEDFAAIGRKPPSWRARGELDRMRYNSLLEMVAEQAQCDPDFITDLNPSINWHQLAAGDSVRIPTFRPSASNQQLPTFRSGSPNAHSAYSAPTIAYSFIARSASHVALINAPAESSESRCASISPTTPSTPPSSPARRSAKALPINS